MSSQLVGLGVCAIGGRSLSGGSLTSDRRQSSEACIEKGIRRMCHCLTVGSQAYDLHCSNNNNSVVIIPNKMTQPTAA